MLANINKNMLFAEIDLIKSSASLSVNITLIFSIFVI